MTSPPEPAPSPVPPIAAETPGAHAAALEMTDVVEAIFRMFDGHIGAVLNSCGHAFDDAAHPAVTLVGVADPAPGGSVPHG